MVMEMVEAAVDSTTSKVTNLANTVYSASQMPENMKESKFLVIPMSVVEKTVLKVLHETRH